MGKHVHKLSEIDPSTRSATCAHCGPVSIRRHNRDGWRCNQSDRRERNRSTLTKNKNATCDRCGFVPVHPCQLDIHHRDRNNRNNSPDNLETLCACCHRLEHVEELPAWGKLAAF